jgi:PhnB protein
MADEPQFAPIQVYLTIKGADAASRFYQRAFGAKERQRQVGPDNQRLIHVDMSVFGGQLMFSDEFPEGGFGEVDTLSPVTRGGASATVHVNLKTPEEVKRVMESAAREGARITSPAEKAPWGAVYGRLLDPFGHSWSFAAPSEPPPERATPPKRRARPAAKRSSGRASAKPARAPAKRTTSRGAAKPGKGRSTRGKKR